MALSSAYSLIPLSGVLPQLLCLLGEQAGGVIRQDFPLGRGTQKLVQGTDVWFTEINFHPTTMAAGENFTRPFLALSTKVFQKKAIVGFRQTSEGLLGL